MTNSSAYLINRVNSSREYSFDLVYDLKNILEKALEWQKQSIENFKWLNQEEMDSPSYKMYWAMSCEADQRAKGLIDAYQMIAGREVINITSAIKNEIEWLEKTFEIEFANAH